MEESLLYSLWHNPRAYGNDIVNETRINCVVMLHSLPQNHSIKLLICFRHIPDPAALTATSKT